MKKKVLISAFHVLGFQRFISCMFYLLHVLTFMCYLCSCEVLEKGKEGQYLCSAFGEEAEKWTGGILRRPRQGARDVGFVLAGFLVLVSFSFP